jgi:hypothetical protein
MNLLNNKVRVLLIGLLACAVGLAFIASSHAVGARTPAVDSELVVHEWGTFTSIAGNDGQAVVWTPSGSDVLPGFIEHFGWALSKTNLRGTVRMETPVLYFYSPRATDLSVHVAFSRGLITEWYPHAGRVNSIVSARWPSEAHSEDTPLAGRGLTSMSLYKQRADGDILWGSVHLEPGKSTDFARDLRESHYYAARETSATPLRVSTQRGAQQERFLFYRGVSAMDIPISARLAPDGNLLVRNLDKAAVANVILFERRGDKVGYRISGELQNEVPLQPPDLTANVDRLYADLEEILVAHGLYRDEARAMIKTWHTSWFEEGSRLFYIVPQSFVDSILPLTINPAPAQTVRVFVGRMEIVTPATERALEITLVSDRQLVFVKYGRFLEPILETIAARDPARAKRLRDLAYAPCCPQNAQGH